MTDALDGLIERLEEVATNLDWEVTEAEGLGVNIRSTRGNLLREAATELRRVRDAGPCWHIYGYGDSGAGPSCHMCGKPNPDIVPAGGEG